MGSTSSRLALALTVMLGLALPPAVQGEEQPSSSPTTGFRLQASNGYEITVIAGSEGSAEEGQVVLFATKLQRGVFYGASYLASATVTETTVEADLGSLGRIAVTQAPTGRTKRVRVGCEGRKRRKVDVARFEGTIEFHGEEGFTEVNTTGAPVEYEIFRRLFCPGEGGRPVGPKLSGARLEVDRYGGAHELEVNVEQSRSGARTSLSAETNERRGGIEIGRATETWAGADALRFDPRLRTATLSPPAPFAGQATFRRGARPANRWRGSLTVDLPGRSDVPLTGAGLHVSLIRPRA